MTDPVDTPTRSARSYARLPLVGVAVATTIFLVLFSGVAWWISEWLRHCATDCGDMGGRLAALGLAGTSLLVPAIAAMAAAALHRSRAGRANQAWPTAIELASGGVGVIWLGLTLVAPLFAVATLGIGIFGLLAAGHLYRRIIAAPREHLGGFAEGRIGVLARQYLPYGVTAVVIVGVFVVSLIMSSRGGACRPYTIAHWDGCTSDGSLTISAIWTIAAASTGALVINTSYRIRRARTTAGWFVTLPIALVFTATTVASHILGASV